MTKSFHQAFNFFRRNAGGIVGETAKSAIALARAERWAHDADIWFGWEPDPDTDLGDHEYWCKNAKDVERLTKRERNEYEIHECEHEGYACIAYQPCEDCGLLHTNEPCRQCEILASLGGIIDPSDDYRRVIEAELALEAMPASLPLDDETKLTIRRHGVGGY